MTSNDIKLIAEAYLHTFPMGSKVTVGWPNTHDQMEDGIVVSSNPLVIKMDHDQEEYQFEKHGEFWYEINNNTEPVVITPSSNWRLN